jgi:hypothetical protein
MKTGSNFCRLALASLFVFTLAQATVWAQSSEGKPAAPPAPPTPSPLPVKPVADKSAPAGWTRYEIGEPARLSLLLPSQPGASAERMNVAPGVTVMVQTFLSPTDSGVYGAMYLDGLPAVKLDKAFKQTLFESFVGGFARGFQKGLQASGRTGQLTILEQRATTMSGLTGYEQDFSFDTLKGRVRLVFDRGRAYAVVAFWNALSSNSERSTFFESLRVTKRLRVTR